MRKCTGTATRDDMPIKTIDIGKDDMIIDADEIKKSIDAGGNTFINKLNELNNHINVLMMNSKTDFYEELKKLMGEEETVKFVAKSAINGEYGNIFKKIFLEGKDKSDYPLAFYNGEFRFYDEEGNVVSLNPDELVELVNEKTINCILRTNGYIITNTLSSRGIGEVGSAFDGTFDLLSLQTKVHDMVTEKGNKKKYIKRKLIEYVKVTEKEHPLFFITAKKISIDDLKIKSASGEKGLEFKEESDGPLSSSISDS